MEVSDRFHIKPLLRTFTFPQAAFVLAVSLNAVRLIEASPDLPADRVDVPDLPSDAASAIGRSVGWRYPAAGVTPSLIERRRVSIGKRAATVPSCPGESAHPNPSSSLQRA